MNCNGYTQGPDMPASLLGQSVKCTVDPLNNPNNIYSIQNNASNIPNLRSYVNFDRYKEYYAGNQTYLLENIITMNCSTFGIGTSLPLLYGQPVKCLANDPSNTLNGNPTGKIYYVDKDIFTKPTVFRWIGSSLTGKNLSKTKQFENTITKQFEKRLGFLP